MIGMEQGELVGYVDTNRPFSAVIEVELGYVKREAEDGVFVVFLKSFPGARPDNLDRWTAAKAPLEGIMRFGRFTKGRSFKWKTN